MLACVATGLGDQRTTPISVQELDIIAKRQAVWSGELDLENRTQGIPDVFGPFAVQQQQRISLWVRYGNIRNVRLSAGYQSISRDAIPQAGARAYHENRYNLTARLTQRRDYAQHYEEAWLVIRSFTDGAGNPIAFPGLRLRYGQNYQVGTGATHSFAVYEELAFKLAPSSYSADRFDHVRLNVLYAFPLEPGLSMQAGMRFQDAIRPMGGTYNFSYGPVFVLNYMP